ncbi:MAG: hypothetical protein J1F17_01990 [Oscillospiraceae bacterium]|nr:hypothetical protein [Oscillospiraceae bacterium]
MNIKFYRNLEIVGVFLVFGLSVLFHFIYDLTDGSVFSILFGAVNESVWENTKIFLIAYSIWAVVELLVSNVHFKKFVVSKVLGVYFMGGIIIIVNYIITLFSEEPACAVHIVLGFLAVVFSQLLSYKLVTGSKDMGEYFVPSLFLLGLFLVAFFSFTVFPPHLGIFRDDTTGFYGIVPGYVDKGDTVLSMYAKNI